MPKHVLIMAGAQGLNGADVDFEVTWQTLEKAFTEIHTKNASVLSFEELYRAAYKIVLKKKGQDLTQAATTNQFRTSYVTQHVTGSAIE